MAPGITVLLGVACLDLALHLLLLVICATTTASASSELHNTDSLMVVALIGVCRAIVIVGVTLVLRANHAIKLIASGFVLFLLAACATFFVYKLAVAKFNSTDLPDGLPMAIAIMSAVSMLCEMLVWLRVTRSFQPGPVRRKVNDESMPLLDGTERRNYTREGPSSVFSGLLSDGAEQKLRGPVTVTVPKLTDITPRATRTRAPGIGRSRARLNSDVLDDMDFAADDLVSQPLLGESNAENISAEVMEKSLKMSTRRRNVLNELIQTERSYFKQLEMISTVFYRPLCNAALGQQTGVSYSIVIQESQVRTIFGELEAMILLSKELLTKLEKRVESLPENTPIADIFIKITPYFRLYKVFALNFEHGLQTISACRENAGFRRFLKDCLKKPECGKMWLEDHLIIPIQRIPRYILLLKELQRFTPELHTDYGHLTETLEQISAVAQEMNNVKKEVEKRLLAIQVQRVIKRCPKDLSPAIVFLNDFPCVEIAFDTSDWREAALGIPSRHGKPRPVRDVVLFVFNELVIDATHSVLRGTISRSFEAAKGLTRSDLLRPVMLDAQGKEALHKFKMVHHAHPQDVMIRDLGNLEFSFNYGAFEVFYQSPSKREKELLLEAVRELQTSWQQDSVRRMSASGGRRTSNLGSGLTEASGGVSTVSAALAAAAKETNESLSSNRRLATVSASSAGAKPQPAPPSSSSSLATSGAGAGASSKPVVASSNTIAKGKAPVPTALDSGSERSAGTSDRSSSDRTSTTRLVPEPSSISRTSAESENFAHTSQASFGSDSSSSSSSPSSSAASSRSPSPAQPRLTRKGTRRERRGNPAEVVESSLTAGNGLDDGDRTPVDLNDELDELVKLADGMKHGSATDVHDSTTEGILGTGTPPPTQPQSKQQQQSGSLAAGGNSAVPSPKRKLLLLLDSGEAGETATDTVQVRRMTLDSETGESSTDNPEETLPATGLHLQKPRQSLTLDVTIGESVTDDGPATPTRDDGASVDASEA